MTENDVGSAAGAAAEDELAVDGNGDRGGRWIPVAIAAAAIGAVVGAPWALGFGPAGARIFTSHEIPVHILNLSGQDVDIELAFTSPKRVTAGTLEAAVTPFFVPDVGQPTNLVFELLADDGLTYAALILLGTRASLGRHLAQAEVVFEYRSSEAPGPANQREELRQGVLLSYDRIWELVNLRNDLQHFQDGLFVLDVPTFDERAVREALLNAVSHRDYRDAGSVFVRQYPRRIEIVSPGGFPAGITQENLLWQQKPRNRRVAEALARCGLVERAGQGFDLIYGECIRHGKALPDFNRTDEHFVWLTLHGTIQDPAFLRFLEKVGNETQVSFDLEDLLVLDLVHREQKVEGPLARRLGPLLEHGVLERVGRGRGTRHLLSRRFYKALGKTGAYTRRRGLDRETNKELLVKHIEGAQPAGAVLADLQEVLPGLSRDQVRTLLRDLRDEGRIEVRGVTKAARWYPAAKPKETQ